jgi:hypothetical protein
MSEFCPFCGSKETIKYIKESDSFHCCCSAVYKALYQDKCDKEFAALDEHFNNDCY